MPGAVLGTGDTETEDRAVDIPGNVDVIWGRTGLVADHFNAAWDIWGQRHVILGEVGEA